MVPHWMERFWWGALTWCSPDWWAYLLEKPSPYFSVSRWTAFWCRVHGHPRGPIFYNAGGLEPNPHCKDCGDIIG